MSNRSLTQNVDVLADKDLGLVVRAGGGVWAEGGLIGKDEGLVVHGGKPLAAGAGLHKRACGNLNEVLFRRVGVFDCPKAFIKGPVCVRREC